MQRVDRQNKGLCHARGRCSHGDRFSWPRSGCCQWSYQGRGCSHHSDRIGAVLGIGIGLFAATDVGACTGQRRCLRHRAILCSDGRFGLRTAVGQDATVFVATFAARAVTATATAATAITLAAFASLGRGAVHPINWCRCAVNRRGRRIGSATGFRAIGCNVTAGLVAVAAATAAAATATLLFTCGVQTFGTGRTVGQCAVVSQGLRAVRQFDRTGLAFGPRRAARGRVCSGAITQGTHGRVRVGRALIAAVVSAAIGALTAVRAIGTRTALGAITSVGALAAGIAAALTTALAGLGVTATATTATAVVAVATAVRTGFTLVGGRLI